MPHDTAQNTAAPAMNARLCNATSVAGGDPPPSHFGEEDGDGLASSECCPTRRLYASKRRLSRPS